MAKSVKDMVRQYERNRYAFSEFLGLAEQDDVLKSLKEFPGVPYAFYGGVDGAERVVLRVGSPDVLGYEEPWPIALVEVKPKNAKFSDDLTHRDFLGSLMNLGLERDRLGDIYIADNVGYVFCLEANALYIVEQLERVKHTSVVCSVIEELPAIPALEPEEVMVQCASLRTDLVLAKVYNLSRNAASELFTQGRVFVNGRMLEHGSYELDFGEIVSVRGHGRFWLAEDRGLSRKGKRNLTVYRT